MTGDSFGDLSKKLVRISKISGDVNRAAVKQAAQAYKDATLASAAGDIGSDLRMSHWGWNGRTYRQPKLGVYYDVRGAQRATALVKPKPIGLWVFLEAGSKPYTIRVRTRKNRKPKNGLAFAGGGFAASANRKRKPGKKTWSRGLRAGEPIAKRIFAATYQRELQRRWTR